MSRARFLFVPFVWPVLLVAGFIVYGSLYPFHWYAGPGGNPFTLLFSRTDWPDQPIGEFMANILLYLPLGFVGVLAIDARTRASIRVLTVSGVGTLICLSVEIIQFYDWSRVSTLTDVYPNVLGTALGAIAGAALGRPHAWNRLLASYARPIPLLLFAAFLITKLYPFAPSIHAEDYWHAIRPLWHHPHIGLSAIVSDVVQWLAMATLIETCIGPSRSRRLLSLLAIGMLAGQIVVINRGLSPTALLGAAVAVAGWSWLTRLQASRRTLAVAAALVISIVLSKLWPFDWLANLHEFSWPPFHTWEHKHASGSIRLFAHDFFIYGCLIQMITKNGAHRLAAGWAVAAGLLGLALLQTLFRGTSADSADAIIAVLATVALWIADGRERGQAKP